MTSSWICSACSPKPACVPTAPLTLPAKTRFLHSSRRSRCLFTSYPQTANLKPKVIGQGVLPVGSANHNGVFVREGLFLQEYLEFNESFLEYCYGIFELQRIGCVYDVVACCPKMHVCAALTTVLRECTNQRGNVMFNLLLNRFNPFNLNVFGGCHLSDFFSILLWDVSDFSMRQSQRCFNVQQFLCAGFFVEDFEHFWRSVTTSVYR